MTSEATSTRMISTKVTPGVLSRPRAFSTLALVHLEHAEFDAGYVSRLKSGDSETQKHFTAYFSSVIWLKLSSRVRARKLSEEIRQESFARVLNFLTHGKTIDYPERCGGFVLAVCNNVMLEVLRQESQQPHTSSPAEEPRDERVKFDADIVTEERKRMVREVLAELPDKDRMLLRMVFLEEGDRAAISRHFNVGTDYLRVLLHRAKERFREAVRKKGTAAGLS